MPHVIATRGCTKMEASSSGGEIKAKEQAELNEAKADVQLALSKVQEDLHKVEADLSANDASINAVEREINAVEREIKAVEKDIAVVRDKIDSFDKVEIQIQIFGQLREDKKQLREDKKQLREDKKQLRKKEEQLREDKKQLRLEEAKLRKKGEIPKNCIKYSYFLFLISSLFVDCIDAQVNLHLVPISALARCYVV